MPVSPSTSGRSRRRSCNVWLLEFDILGMRDSKADLASSTIYLVSMIGLLLVVIGGFLIIL
jgi:hypothetical protein